jgi:hypothetical protein
MKGLQLTNAPVAKAEMLIRKPVAEVFEAFIDPAITTSSGLPKVVESSNQISKSSGIGKCIIFLYRLV